MTPPYEQRDAKGFLHTPDSGAGRGQREIRSLSAMRNAAGFSDVKEKSQIDEIEAHLAVPAGLGIGEA